MPFTSLLGQKSTTSAIPLSQGTRGSGLTHDAEWAPVSSETSHSPNSIRNSTWSRFTKLQNLTLSYEEIDNQRPRKQTNLSYDESGTPDNKLTRLYNYIVNTSIVMRWFLFIVPLLAILWIPGIFSVTIFPNARVWSVRLLWWSVWLSICWGGWWGALLVSRLTPIVMRSTMGVVAIGTRQYIGWTQALHRYIALFVWTLVIWVSWIPIIYNHRTGTNNDHALVLIAKLLFAFLLCSGILLFEKFAIQWIAANFHETSYADRIADQTFALRSLATLYLHSSDTLGRSDTLRIDSEQVQGVNPQRLLKQFRRGVRTAATTTTTAFGTVASEITGSHVLQPNSPLAIVQTAIESATKSRMLARRLFYSFARPGSDYFVLDDIASFFENPDEASHVFALFDKDTNGDVSRDEIELACLDFHKEQVSLERSMRDIDSAVSCLDNILMSVYIVVAVLIIAVALENQLVTLVTGAGTLILGLSWLIGGSLQEVLTSIIFLFVKHPFDVGDGVVIKDKNYTVKEINLLSTVFLDSNNVLVLAPSTILNTLFIQNIRRSPQMSETFTFDVSYGTTFEDLEKLREKMLNFVQTERRDYQPAFDIAVQDFPGQEKITLAVDIKYKNNGNQSALKARRRNKWVCALKTSLAEVNIYGPKGNPNAPPIGRYTKVPWEELQEGVREATQMPAQAPAHPITEEWRLADKNAVTDGDIFGEDDQLYVTGPKSGPSEDDNLRRDPSISAGTGLPTASPAPIRLDKEKKTHP